MGVFTGLPQMVLFLAQVLFIVIQIVILMRLTMESHSARRTEASVGVKKKTKKRAKR